jgi:hypothetical protein
VAEKNGTDTNDYLIEIKLDLEAVEEDRKFKRETMDDLKKIESSIDLKQHVRRYVECISMTHGTIGKITNDTAENAEKTILRCRDIYRSKGDNEESDLIAAIKIDDKGDIIERQYLSMEQIDYRRYYKAKNGPLVNLSKRYVTSEIGR